MASQDIIYLTFEKYLNKAKELHKAGDLLNAKKFYLLAAGEMLQLAKMSTGEVQKTRNVRVKNLMDIAKSLDVQNGGNGNIGQNGNNITSEPREKVSLEDSLNKLNSLIGLEKVKKQVNDWVKQIQVFQKRKASGLSVPEMSYHLVFSGNPGTGKTTVARIMADIYCALGIVSKGHLVEVSKPDLVAGFVGQTSIKTQDVLNKAYGGVLFVDEAYSITVGGEFGQESIDTMVKYMEDKRDDIVVIVAGYEGPMKNFIATNMGLRSRFKNFITFDDYTGEELFQIFKKLCKGNQYETTAEAEAYIKNHLRKLYLNRGADYANGRDARNLFESIVTNQSARVSQIANPSNEDLVTITVEDLPFIGEVKMDDCFILDETEVAPTKAEEIPDGKAPQNDQNGSVKDLIPENPSQEREEKQRSPEDKVLDGAGVIDSEFKFDWDNLPSITFDDVAGLEQVKETVRVKVLLPLKNSEAFEGYVKKSGGGLLLYGPPGTGKTMIAAAIANEIGAKFCSVKPSDLLHQGAGQSEKAIRALFAQARQFPCSVVYFDEMDSISPKNTRSQYAKQLRSEFLAQLQGIDSYGKDNGHILFLIAATNKPWDIDSAFVRPGRFGTRIYVGLPDSPARNYMVESRLSKIAKKGIVKVAEDIPYEEIVEKTEGFNCSDISNLLDKIEELSIIRGIRTGEKSILREDFDKALEEIKSSVQRDDIEKLQEWTAENN